MALLQAVEDLALDGGGQRRGVDEIDARLVFDAGRLVDELGVGERLNRGAADTADPRRSARGQSARQVPCRSRRRRWRPARRPCPRPAPPDYWRPCRPRPASLRSRPRRCAECRSRAMARRSPDRKCTSGRGRCRPPPARKVRGSAARISAVVMRRSRMARRRAGKVARWSPQK